MTALEQMMQKQDQQTNAGIMQVAKDNNWAQTFHNTPPAEVLRQNRNVMDMVSAAAERKMAILAQTDAKAAELYHKNAEFNEWQRQAPLRDQLLRSQIDAQGAASRFKQEDEFEENTQMSNFTKHMMKAPPKGSPEYQMHVLRGVAENPKIARTDWGKDMLKNLAEENDTVARVKKLLGEVPEGFQPDRVVVGEGKQTAITASRADKVNKDVVKAEANYLAAQAAKDSVFNAIGEKAWKANKNNVRTDAEQTVALTKAKYDALKEAYSPQEQAQSASGAAPEEATQPKRFRYNPETGKLE